MLDQKTHNLSLPTATIELPLFMNHLDQEVIDSLEYDDPHKVISCGVHPCGNLLIVAIDCRVYEFDFMSFHIPLGDFIPVDRGERVFLPNTDGRWPGMSKGFYVSAKWLIENSSCCGEKSHLHLGNTYLGEIDIEGPATTNP